MAKARSNAVRKRSRMTFVSFAVKVRPIAWRQYAADPEVEHRGQLELRRRVELGVLFPQERREWARSPFV
jgi:hypothetical protein